MQLFPRELALYGARKHVWGTFREKRHAFQAPAGGLLGHKST